MFTDKEHRILLSAIRREKEVCKRVDAELIREPYEDTLVSVCRSIERKVHDIQHKYAWHDIRRNTWDLPDDDVKVECVTETRTGSRNHVFGYHSDGRWCCGMNSNVIAWRHIEPFEEDKE